LFIDVVAAKKIKTDLNDVDLKSESTNGKVIYILFTDGIIIFICSSNDIQLLICVNWRIMLIFDLLVQQKRKPTLFRLFVIITKINSQITFYLHIIIRHISDLVHVFESLS
jgi:hypothetical protein